MIVHDLRTPTHAILGLAELVARTWPAATPAA